LFCEQFEKLTVVLLDDMINKLMEVLILAQRKMALACSVCGSRNYIITANPNRTERLEVKKFCKYCQKHTLHRETK
jgi:large subunit ribosomal protein L33